MYPLKTAPRLRRRLRNSRLLHVLALGGRDVRTLLSGFYRQVSALRNPAAEASSSEQNHRLTRFSRR